MSLDDVFIILFLTKSFSLLEERKIIYIGGLTEDTTKDEIRRKFLNYGTIKKISFHSKDDGLAASIFCATT